MRRFVVSGGHDNRWVPNPNEASMTDPSSTPTQPASESAPGPEVQVAETGFHPIAGIAAIALPGLGHAARGEPRRGLYAGIGVLGLFVGGVLIGGVDCIDSREDGLWFIGQALVGPVAFGVDALHQRHFKVLDPVSRLPRTAHPGEVRDDKAGFFTPAVPLISPLDSTGKPLMLPPNMKGVGKMNELGTLFATVAGMMNLIVIIDAAFPTTFRRVRIARPATTEAKS